jgi:hypothetical protein
VLNIAAALAAYGVPFGETLSGNTVAENSAIGTAVGMVSSFDLDANASLSYSLIDSAGGRFAINASTGVLTAAVSLDYEAGHSWQVTARASDGAHVFDKAFTINVTDVNEAPTDATLSGGSVAENSANGTIVGSVTGTDPDAGASLHYALTDNAGGRFAINPVTGVITVANGTLLDYETAHSHQITVRTADQNGLALDKTFTIAVSDVSERVHADFNGDGRSDILWTSDNGGVALWDSGRPGHVVADAGTTAGWHIAGVGDFNGDGRSDSLWRSDNGVVALWDSGTPGHVVADVGTTTNWHIAGVGDFDGNGKADILWWNDNGAVAVWDNGTPGHVVADAGTTASWHIAGVGDFDGNGKADILWQNDNSAVAVWDNGAPAGGHIIADPSQSLGSWHIV